MAIPSRVLAYIDARYDIPTFFSPHFVNGSHFQNYFTSGEISSTSRQVIVSLSVVYVVVLVAYIEVQHSAKINPAVVSIESTICALICLKLFIPRGLTFAGSAMSNMESSPGKGNRLVMAGSSSEVALVFSDKARLWRCAAMGLAQCIFTIVLSYAAISQTMASLHMNFFSVLPPVDFVLQRLVLKVNMLLSRRTIAGTVINIVPQLFSFLARNWEMNALGFVIALMYMVWIFFVCVEQGTVEAGEWLTSLYVSYLAAAMAFVPIISVGMYLAATFGAGDGATLGMDALAMPNLIAGFIAGFALFILFLLTGYLIKVSSSAHVIALVSTTSMLLILGEGLVNFFLATIGAILVTLAWIVYVG